MWLSGVSCDPHPCSRPSMISFPLACAADRNSVFPHKCKLSDNILYQYGPNSVHVLSTYYIFLYCIIVPPHPPTYAFTNTGRTSGVQLQARRFCLCHCTQTGSETHHAIYTVSTERSFSGSTRMSEGDYPPLHSSKVNNARDNTFTSLYVHMVTKLCRDNLTLHVFHSKSSSPTHPLLSPVI